MIWNIIVNCLCGAVIAELAWQLRKRRRRIDKLERDTKTYDEILNDTQAENGRLRKALEQTQKRLAQYAGCPEMGYVYRVSDVATKTVEAKRHVSRMQVEDASVDVIGIVKDDINRELLQAVKPAIKISQENEGSTIIVRGRVIVGLPAEGETDEHY